MRRSVVTLLALFCGLVLSFVWFGDRLEAALGSDSGPAELEAFGTWAWLAGIGLLVADLLLPIPTSAVLAALGVVYGGWLGGAIGAAGCFLSGTVAYWLCRTVGDRGARFLLGTEDLERARRFFGERGALLVAASRWAPILPEMLSCLAGLSRMPWPRFALATLCGSLPLAFAWAWVGAVGRETPGAALLVSALVPLALWWVVMRRLRPAAAD